MDPCDGLVVVHLANQIRLIPGDDNGYILRVGGMHTTNFLINLIVIVRGGNRSDLELIWIGAL